MADPISLNEKGPYSLNHIILDAQGRAFIPLPSLYGYLKQYQNSIMDKRVREIPQ